MIHKKIILKIMYKYILKIINIILIKYMHLLIYYNNIFRNIIKDKLMFKANFILIQNKLIKEKKYFHLQFLKCYKIYQI